MKNKMKKLLSMVLILLLMLSVLASCAAKSDAEESLRVENAVTDGTSGSSQFSDATKEEIGEATQGNGGEEAGEYAVKIIRTAELHAETKEFDKARAQLEADVAALGGYMESSDVQGRNYAAQNGNYGTRYAKFSLRIPAEKLDEFLGKAGELLNVTSSVITATDVSNEYYDIEARLSVLETERQVLERMLASATSVSNMITVEERLYDVIYEIESYKTMLKVYDSKVAYSTVKLSLSEVTDLTVVTEGNGFGDRFKKAVRESWQNFVDFCRDAVIWLVYALPTLIVLALIGSAVVVFIVWRKRKRRARKLAEAEKNEQ